tara:strand:+ start:592 stop:813 length:222 start_codon:yes stop_codon:yes gene_type:complete
VGFELRERQFPGLRSGLYGGRNESQQPCLFRTSAAGKAASGTPDVAPQADASGQIIGTDVADATDNDASELAE